MFSIRSLLYVVIIACIAIACGSSEGADPNAINTPNPGSGGSGGSDVKGSGGASNKAGGSASGGSTSTGGGTSATGGSTAGGGESSAVGGSAAQGGSTAASGGTASTGGASAGGSASVQPVRIGFVGDQGNNSNTELALDLLKTSKVDLAVILGDFDYASNAKAWNELMTNGLGANFPWLAVAGNHDTGAWADYSKIIEDKVKKVAGLEYTGTPGESASYKFRGVQIVTSGIKTLGNEADQKASLEKNLKAATLPWRVCAWHKVHADMNTGMKGTILDAFDQVSADTYKLCADNGAFVMTGHEHAYSRTRTLGCLGDDPNDHCPDTTQTDEVLVGGGKSFVTVSGLGGREIRNFYGLEHDDDTWWASYYTADREMVKGKRADVKNSSASVGITVIDFNVDGDPKKARGTFLIAQNGRKLDEYVIRLK